MKRILGNVFMLLPLLSLQAQQQGTIFYERKVNMHRRADDEQMKAMLPEFRTSKHVLLFSDSVSVYKSVKEDEAPDPFENPGGGGPRIMIRVGPGQNSILYKNFSNRYIREQTEFADKNYIIDDTIKIQPWKLNDETKVFINHTCKKATLTTPDGRSVTAWYAEDISTPVGPESFGGLPGAILAIDVNDAEVVITATDIKQQVDKKELIEPRTGKHISRSDFQKKVEEVLGPAGPGGRRTIRM